MTMRTIWGRRRAVQAGHGADAYALLDHFAERHPESIFKANAPVLLANAYLQQNDPQGALRVLVPLADSPQASHADFRYALGRAYQTVGRYDACRGGVSEFVCGSAVEHGGGDRRGRRCRR